MGTFVDTVVGEHVADERAPSNRKSCARSIGLEAGRLPQFKDISWRWIAYAASTLLIAASVFASFHEVELKQDVPCEIVSSSEVKIQGFSGLVSAIYFRASDHVERGMPLFQLTRDFSLSSDGRQRPQFDEEMRNDQIRTTDLQFRERNAGIDAQMASARLTEQARVAEMRALDGQLAQSREIADEARQRLARLKSVSDYVTADRIEQASADAHQGDVVIAQGAARRQQLQADLDTVKGTQTGLASQRRELEAQHARDVQDIRMRFEQMRQNVTISAPRAGTVTFSSLVPGRMLDATDVALVIGTEPQRPLIAALRIPSRQRGFVAQGQIIRIKLDAFPYVRFGTYEAHIDSISGTTVGASVALGASSGMATEGDYMAWATLQGNTFNFGGQQFRILSGMRGTASIVVERRSIAEWVLAPLFRMLRG
jgi:membrane fusion protein